MSKATKSWIAPGVVVAIIVAGLIGCSSKPDQSTEEETPTLQSSKDIKNLQVVAHLKVPVEETRNVLYCGTMKLAWNKMTEDMGEPPQLEGDLGDILNADKFSLSDVDEESVTVLAGTDEVTINRIMEQMRELGADPRPFPANLTRRYAALVMLRKSLQFSHEFEQLPHPIFFSGGKVKGFGLRSHEPGSQQSKAWTQVQLCDFKDRNDYVVKLRCKSEEDELILALVPVRETLESMVANAVQRSKLKSNLVPASLAIPFVQTYVAHRFDELIDKDFQNPKFRDSVLVEALQVTQFRLDHKGVVLKSAALLAKDKKDGGKKREPIRPHLYFNRPFLLILKRRDSPRPYFVMWVATPHLLTKPDKKP